MTKLFWRIAAILLLLYNLYLAEQVYALYTQPAEQTFTLKLAMVYDGQPYGIAYIVISGPTAAAHAENSLRDWNWIDERSRGVTTLTDEVPAVPQRCSVSYQGSQFTVYSEVDGWMNKLCTFLLMQSEQANT